MCVAGLYFVFLLLEDVIVAYYSTDAASQGQDVNLTDTYSIMPKDAAKSLEKLNGRPSNLKNKLLNTNIFSTMPRKQKKWKMDRVTRKQYEIINMLWRKTKIFMDEDDTDHDVITSSPNYQQNLTKVMSRRSTHPMKLTTVLSSIKTTTPSNIEFDYLDDSQNYAHKIVCTEKNCKQSTKIYFNSNSGKITSKPYFYVFHIKGPNAKLQLSKANKLLSSNPKFVDLPNISRIKLNKPNNEKLQATVKQNSLKFKFEIAKDKLTSIMYDNQNHISMSKNNNTESTTFYDKIKFFELYDQNTRASDIKHVNTSNGLPMDYNDDIETIYSRKFLPEHVDQGSYDHKQAKHSKKHITESFQSPEKFYGKENDIGTLKSESQRVNLSLKKQINVPTPGRNITKSLPSNYNTDVPYMYENASWSEYPFAAVYIYKPSQVHCDAAGISANWLVASGSCLSRVHKNPHGEGRSAFVAYCGEQWWRPERVAYVKYSLVHPSYHFRDKTRSHLYNIGPSNFSFDVENLGVGVIQVVTSMMSACTGWAPVTLISHQFNADSESTWASAVGWGVDRFDTRYGATDLPKTSLMVYKSFLYFDSCPGNIGYSKAKRLDEGGGVRNVHCMSLPPYHGEENDPVHGGLLLVGGKLIALYLQEERRPQGEQSAQYTGVWRLIPWLMEVAREPDEKDAFIVEI